jgi:hypothetical protein
VGVESLLPLAFLLTLLLAVGGLGFVLARSPVVGTVVLMAAYIPTQAIAEDVDLTLVVNGFSVYAVDVVASLMLAIGVKRLLTPHVERSLARPLLVLVALFAVHLLWGASQLGLQPAVSAGRAWLHFIGPLVYGVTAIPRWRRSSLGVFVVGALILSVYAFAFIARYGLHGANTPLEVGGRMSFDSRPLDGTAALLIVQCILILVAARLLRTPLLLVALAAMCATVAIVQYRTVWVIAALVLAIAYVHWARGAIFLNERAALLAASAIFLFAPVAAYAATSSSAFQYSVESATGRESTLRWRTESWSALLREHDSPTEIALGIPMGTSLAREIDGRIVDRSPHNVYIDAQLTFGILGTVIMAWLGVTVIRRRRIAAAALELAPSLIVLLVLAQALFGVTTMFGPVQGVLLGALLQASFLARSREPDARRPDEP